MATQSNSIHLALAQRNRKIKEKKTGEGSKARKKTKNGRSEFLRIEKE